MYVRAAQTIS
jgi:hypothetical protein